MGLFSGLLRNKAEQMRYQQMMGSLEEQYGDHPLMKQKLAHVKNMYQMGRPDLAQQYFLTEMQPQQQTGPQFITKQNPFGQGGIGQVDTATGKIVNYRPAMKKEKREREKDYAGRWRYTDTGELVFKDVEAPMKEATGLEKRYADYKAAGGTGTIDDMLKLSSPSTTVNVGGVSKKRPLLEEAKRLEAAGDKEGAALVREEAYGKPSEAQMRAIQTADKTGDSIDILTEKGEDGRPLFEQLTNFGDSWQSKLPGGNYLLDPDYQMAQQAITSAVSGILRMETGAQANDQEIAVEMSIYAPKPGDSPAVIRQKLQALKNKYQAAKKLSGAREQGKQEEITIGPLSVNGVAIEDMSVEELQAIINE